MASTSTTTDFTQSTYTLLEELTGLIQDEIIDYEGSGNRKWGTEVVRNIAKALKTHNNVRLFLHAVKSDSPTQYCCTVDSSGRRYEKIIRLWMRMWKFPWIKSMKDLRARSMCEHPYSLKAGPVCINPTHYEGSHQKKPELRPIVIFKGKNYGSQSKGPFWKASWMPNDATTSSMSADESTSQQEQAFFNCELQPIDEMRGIDPNEQHSDTSSFISGQLQMDPNSPTNGAPSPALSHTSSLYFDASGRSLPTSPANSVDDYFETETRESLEAGLSGNMSWNGNGANIEETPMTRHYIEERARIATRLGFGEQIEIIDDSPEDEGLKPNIENKSPRSNDLQMRNSKSASPDSSMPSENGTAQRYPKKDEDMMEVEDEPMEVDDYHLSIKNMPTKGYELIEFVDMKEWLSVSYYEGMETVGTNVQASSPYYLIDGYAHMSSKARNSNMCRFSIGSVENIQRNRYIADTKKLIGRGVRLYYISGEVYIECLSDYPVFLQSSTYNYRRKFDPNAVIKMPSGCNVKVFSIEEFSRLLELCISKGYNAVHSLMRMCTFRLSFIKGWGMNYKRGKISSTHCWFEAHIVPPIYWLERILKSMEGREQFANSCT